MSRNDNICDGNSYLGIYCNGVVTKLPSDYRKHEAVTVREKPKSLAWRGLSRIIGYIYFVVSCKK